MTLMINIQNLKILVKLYCKHYINKLDKIYKKVYITKNFKNRIIKHIFKNLSSRGKKNSKNL